MADGAGAALVPYNAAGSAAFEGVFGPAIRDTPGQSLAGVDFNAQDFARFALGNDLNRATADFTICGETLRGHACVDDQFEPLAAKWTKDFLGNFHGSHSTLLELKHR